jgi:predicted transcriptional regulator
MATPVTHNERILRVLRKVASVTPAVLAKKTGIPLSSIYKRVHELRVEYHAPIVSETRLVKGQRKVFYRLETLALAA